MQEEFDTENIEYYIIKNLLESDVYARAFIGKLTPEIFSANLVDVFKSIQICFNKVGRIPPVKMLEDVILPQVVKNNPEQLARAKKSLEAVTAINIPVSQTTNLITDETKKFIKNRSIIKAVIKSIDLLNSQKNDDAVAVLEKAFRVSFDESLGLDYFADLESRAARLGVTHEVISTGLPSLNALIGGGYRRKSLFVFAGPGNVGKSLVLNDAAVTLTMAGYNVLYATLELSEDYISQRTDAKFGEVPMNEINADPQAAIKKVMTKYNIMKQDGKKLGRLIYKDYPPNTVSCNEIKALIKTLETKDGFKPDFIIIDYLKLLKTNGRVMGDQLYQKITLICEEMRALAIEENACVLTASQTGRQTYNSSSIGMEDVSDSIGIAQTADVLITLARTETLNADNSILLNVSKSRFSRNQQQMTARVDYDYMRLIDISEGSQMMDMTNKKDFEVNKMPTSKKDKPKSSQADNDFNINI